MSGVEIDEGETSRRFWELNAKLHGERISDALLTCRSAGILWMPREGLILVLRDSMMLWGSPCYFVLGTKRGNIPQLQWLGVPPNKTNEVSWTCQISSEKLTSLPEDSKCSRGNASN